MKLMCPLLTCRCPGVSQKRDGCGTAPYVTCRFAYYVYETDIVLAAWIYVLLLFAFMIHKGMIIIHHYRIRKVVLWAIVQFVWTQLIVRLRMHQVNRVDEAHVHARRIALHRALIYLCVFFSFYRLIL